MSSFVIHENNIKSLNKMGFGTENAIGFDDSITVESWSAEELTYILDGVVAELEANDYKVDAKKTIKAMEEKIKEAADRLL